MSRVLLFVDGPKGPKCIKSASYWTYNRDVLSTVPPLPERVISAVRVASRWWLVECDTASGGRETILN